MSDLPPPNQVPPFYVTASAPERGEDAAAFATEHGYLYVPYDQLPQPSNDPVYVMDYGAEATALLSWYRKAPGPVHVDFVSGALEHRRQHGGGRGEMIAKAVGLKGEVKSLHILDATAGLGRDAFVLAALGCRVDMFERHPVVYCLLKDGMKRALESGHMETVEVVGRMSLHFGMTDWNTQADVIYLDPMFPERQKTSLVKKEMRVFKDLVGSDSDSDSLLPYALAAPVKRVVVKRPKPAPFLADKKPTMQITGKSGRFDIYTIKSLLK
ncbi:SAM-dependent methyltransferase [Hahella sp. CCB-MM4]|uniref:class I SAM-dependent methyltransferase n=1 Tax=Hahella sp. (strain CCB-MM4) TaxID=1926491 RepID=UPI000B9AD5AD|nr:class I SAM-dependent methyltransferase [Hahella sp. CCB-MM4]OZG70602.1 SAM-dependent methyltransferase [Hahella sp. CCB-MM4]